MANKTLFQSLRGRLLPKATATNEAGGRAYQRTPEEVLAQLTATGTLDSTYYASAEMQLDQVLAACESVDVDYIAKAAIYARQKAKMKDMPALLCAVLAVRDGKVLESVFDRCIDSPRMLRTFVQILRSGAVGRKSLGSLPKRLVRQWFAKRSDQQLFAGSVGKSPSLGDVIKMVHPKPTSPQREAMLGYLIGKDVDETLLPSVVQQLHAFRRFETDQVPDVPFQFLTSTNRLGIEEWKQIALRAPWQMTRMNLNTFQRNSVFYDHDVVEAVADRLRDPAAIEHANVFPYQLMTTFYNMDATIPSRIRDAVQDALEISLSNVPRIPGKVYVALDVSGSMHSPITGVRKGSTSWMTCVHVAALIAAAIVRRNQRATVIPFHDEVVKAKINSRDSVATNAERLADLPSGGTNCSAPLAWLNKRKANGDVVIYVSDNQSWVDTKDTSRWATATMREWNAFKARNPDARMVCIDLQPYTTVQACDRDDILNVGGFSDEVFTVMRDFACGRYAAQRWVERIRKTEV